MPAMSTQNTLAVGYVTQEIITQLSGDWNVHLRYNQHGSVTPGHAEQLLLWLILAWPQWHVKHQQLPHSTPAAGLGLRDGHTHPRNEHTSTAAPIVLEMNGQNEEREGARNGQGERNRL